ncbi:CHAP domain-containing protein [Caulobacter sp. 17J80-11]|uniref:CHAP domain-containing protein n=1 Tax=Caulobacter sp. 17J80-11 TaxID=2763502 RepID=UPI001653CA98|nr:CHAP domain-containing protein [Caulobacter sp. 17J80-11]MBC6980202.1 CHAP domain-containing protein [Caulobacter sp. 17J80-11]
MLKKIAGAVAAGAVVLGTAGVGTAHADPYWQCVTFARTFSGIQIFGDAWTWWTQATSAHYATGITPQAGAVLVFQPYGKMTRGHVAVVSQVLTDRIVQVTHANWGGSRGKVEENVTMVDVSEKGDWSKVKVWYDPTGDLGSTVYPTYGFIYQSAKDAAAQVMAQVSGPAGKDAAKPVAAKDAAVKAAPGKPAAAAKDDAVKAALAKSGT